MKNICFIILLSVLGLRLSAQVTYENFGIAHRFSDYKPFQSGEKFSIERDEQSMFTIKFSKLNWWYDNEKVTCVVKYAGVNDSGMYIYRGFAREGTETPPCTIGQCIIVSPQKLSLYLSEENKERIKKDKEELLGGLNPTNFFVKKYYFKVFIADRVFIDEGDSKHPQTDERMWDIYL